ncbi:hypothetical protein [Paenibacillus sp. UMB4589-SE434]|uniref:hypothetical protein n=1 Tax=Paenibacillus sp. UMB4589-SE434 TaxID=3046314 RepID=UPI002551B150|nr:hypothetical protein [Paenibacillus sp. UMB4589-SE434]MDK8182275.1 hypothetical protein [Paenibacillus sp. UMB4589-SE434]
MNKELLLFNETQMSQTPDEKTIERLYIQGLLREVPFEKGRKIIYEIFINGKTESEVAAELKITQQAVSKWRRKTLKYLYQKMSS